MKYAIVAVDCFAKWAEAVLLATITTKKAINFVVWNIRCRFGVPQAIVTDNGTQFDSTEFKDFCHRHHIEKRFAVVTHSQAKCMWIDELPLMLRAYLTTHKSMTDHSPFALAYGSEAMISIELEVPSHRVTHYDPRTNEQLLLKSLDMIDEKQTEAKLRAATYRHQVTRYYNTKVRGRTFEIDDLILNESSLIREHGIASVYDDIITKVRGHEIASVYGVISLEE